MGWARFLWPADQTSILQRATAPCRIQSVGFGLRFVESSRDANGDGCRLNEFKVNGHELEADAADVVVIMIVFHRDELSGRLNFDFGKMFLFTSP